MTPSTPMNRLLTTDQYRLCVDCSSVHLTTVSEHRSAPIRFRSSPSSRTVPPVTRSRYAVGQSRAPTVTDRTAELPRRRGLWARADSPLEFVDVDLPEQLLEVHADHPESLAAPRDGSGVRPDEYRTPQKSSFSPLWGSENAGEKPAAGAEIGAFATAFISHGRAEDFVFRVFAREDAGV